MVDEAHRVSSLDSTYAKVLSNIMAPIRIGFTATLPTAETAQLSLEALIGPVIGELSIEEASELGILAVPKVRLLKTPFSHTIKSTRRYADVYQVGVVESQVRHNLIVDKVMDHAKRGDITLIFVNRIEHGEMLQDTFMEKGEQVPFVRGDMKPQERENIKHSLMGRRRKIAIATTAWREGINIPSLDVIFNAGGGKDELGVIQTIGRGLRRTHGKDEVIIYDIFDPSHHYLISHFGERITLYMELEWL
jgi:superfamily II DNA or RNA helicase